MIRLQAFNAQIYYYMAFYAENQVVSQDVFSAYFESDTMKDDSITNRALAGLNGLMSTFIAQRNGVNSPAAGVTFQTENASPSLWEPVQWNMHVLNEMVMPAVTQVLKESAPLTEISGLTSATKSVSFSDAALHKTLFDVLTGSENMLSAINSLREPFVFQMNATWSDHLWLEHVQTLEAPNSMIVAPVEAISFSLASMFEIPLLQVIVRGPGNNFYNGMPNAVNSDTSPLNPQLRAPTSGDQELLADQGMYMLGRFPLMVPTVPISTTPLSTASASMFPVTSVATELVNELGPQAPMPGRYIYVDAPAWISSDYNVLTPETTEELPTTSDMTADLVKGLTDDQSRYTSMSYARLAFLRYLAEAYFKDIFLNRATARVRIPLCVTPQVGRTYFLKATGQDKAIYIGYLQSVTHTINMGDQVVADTELVFTHVRARDAVLTPIVLSNLTNGVTAQAATTELNDSENQLNAMAAKGMTYNILAPGVQGPVESE